MSDELDPIISGLMADIARVARSQLQEDAADTFDTGDKIARYQNALGYDWTSDEATVTLRGLIPNFLERGLGPGGMGTEGPFDIRQNVLKNGKTTQAVPVAPGVFRTMSVNGKPWIHPGFPSTRLMQKLDVTKVLATVQTMRERFPR